MGEIGVRIVNRLVPTDEAAQLLTERAGERLERRMGEPLGGQHGEGRGRDGKEEKNEVLNHEGTKTPRTVETHFWCADALLRAFVSWWFVRSCHGVPSCFSSGRILPS